MPKLNQKQTNKNYSLNFKERKLKLCNDERKDAKIIIVFKFHPKKTRKKKPNKKSDLSCRMPGTKYVSNS